MSKRQSTADERAASTYHLRELAAADLAELNVWRNDPEVIQSLVAAFRYVALQTDQAWFDDYKLHRATTVRLAVCRAGSDQIIGAVYLTGIDWISRSAELGVWIGAAEHRGKGAGEFACRGILRHAFHDLNLHRVHLSVVDGNSSAQALYLKLGFVEEGRARAAAFKMGAYTDLIRMAILAPEYDAQAHCAE
jgi:diamine N-acetyltransferase